MLTKANTGNQMNQFDEAKQSQYSVIFFTVKILALFFCATPLFSHFFRDNISGTTSSMNITNVLTSLFILLVITVMWLIMDYRRKRTIVSTSIEIIIFYIICLVSILYSKGHQSYSKFMFIFPIVSYTIEYGIGLGMTLATVSSATVLAMDLIMYKEPGVNPYFQNDIALVALFLVVAWILGVYKKTERKHIEELRKYANIDGLTQVYNHRYFYDTFKSYFEKSVAESTPLSLIMCDIDYFKAYNDTHGHQQGDMVLFELAQIIKNNIRANDVVCRYGGEEFIIILPNTTQSDAVTVAERLRTIVYEHEFPGEGVLRNGVLTISSGVAERIKGDDSYTAMIKRVDTALYRAKFFRKNRVEIYTNVFDHLAPSNNESDSSIMSVKSLIAIINSRDCYTYNHIERVVYYCEKFADYIDMPLDIKRRLLCGAYLHDLGKINITKQTLMSSKPLTPEQWDEIKRHPTDGADIVKQLGGLDDTIEMVLQHHEKYNGTGYPLGLKGEEISYLARILTIVDAFDAMTSNRPYKEAMSFEKAFAEIIACKGAHFDPEIADLFVAAMNK
ncbi:MAG: diguanylate cyclase [Clostridiales bacterium]|nr:diguanylate cyclase [Clostridiales bacterium]